MFLLDQDLSFFCLSPSKDIHVRADNFDHKGGRALDGHIPWPTSAQFKNQFLLGQSINVESFLSATFIGPLQRNKYRSMYI